MSDRPDTMVVGRARSADTRTHVERINPGDNPAYVPGVRRDPEDTPLPTGHKRKYRLLEKAIVDGALRKPGEIVEVYESQVGPHHEMVHAPRRGRPQKQK